MASAAEFQAKIEKMAEAMNKFRQGNSNYYSINATHHGSLSETKVWNYTATGYGLTARCEISINQTTMQRLMVADETLAWVIGHELGHCELGHGRIKPALIIPSDAWAQEYDADMVGKRLMQAAGYDFAIASAEIPLILNTLGTKTHPDAKNRMANITASSNARAYPSLVKISKN